MAAPPAGLPAGPPPATGTFATNIGPWLVGGLVSALFTGHSANECFRFLTRWKDESRLNCYVVVALLIVAFAQFAGLIGVLWYFCIEGQQKELGLVLIPIPWAQDIVTLTPTLAAFLCQGFLSKRAYMLWARNVYILIATSFLTFVTFAMGLSWSIWLGYEFELPPGKAAKPNSPLGISLSTAPQWLQSSTDIVLCILVAAKLQTTKTQFNKTTDDILTRLVTMTICSGMLTSTIALIAAVLTQVEKPRGTQYFLAFALQVTPAYTLVVGYSLNSRMAMRNRSTSGGGDSERSRSRANTDPGSQISKHRSAVPAHYNVSIAMESYDDRDKFASPPRTPRTAPPSSPFYSAPALDDEKYLHISEYNQPHTPGRTGRMEPMGF